MYTANHHYILHTKIGEDKVLDTIKKTTLGFYTQKIYIYLR